MSWHLTAGHLVSILENWENLTEDGQFMYMMYIQEKANNLCQMYISKSTLEDDERARNSHHIAIDEIVSYGTWGLKEFGVREHGWSHANWDNLKEAEAKARYWLEQIYGGGYPHERPPKVLEEIKDE